MRSFLLSFLFLICYQFTFAGEPESTSIIISSAKHYVFNNYLTSEDDPGFFDVDFTPRKIKATVLSSILPGSGQTYLGNELKGMAISISFFGTALAGIIAQNNASGREDRIKVLTQDYLTRGNYSDAEKVWQSILAEKAERDNDYKRRNIFTWLAVGVWVYNIFDVIFLTDDFGEGEFSLKNNPVGINLVSNNQFNGIELKINLP